jgi:hypothetical protein
VNVSAQAQRTGQHHRLIPLDQQPERHRIPRLGQPHQVTIGQSAFHTW